jgi:hypothetical protein
LEPISSFFSYDTIIVMFKGIKLPKHFHKRPGARGEEEENATIAAASELIMPDPCTVKIS